MSGDTRTELVLFALETARPECEIMNCASAQWRTPPPPGPRQAGLPGCIPSDCVRTTPGAAVCRAGRFLRAAAASGIALRAVRSRRRTPSMPPVDAPAPVFHARRAGPPPHLGQPPRRHPPPVPAHRCNEVERRSAHTGAPHHGSDTDLFERTLPAFGEQRGPQLRPSPRRSWITIAHPAIRTAANPSAAGSACASRIRRFAVIAP